MAKLLDPFRFLLTSLADWTNQPHLQTIDYLREENRVLREQLDERRLRLEAKRTALESIVAKKADPKPAEERTAVPAELPALEVGVVGNSDRVPTKVPTVGRVNWVFREFEACKWLKALAPLSQPSSKFLRGPRRGSHLQMCSYNA